MTPSPEQWRAAAEAVATQHFTPEMNAVLIRRAIEKQVDEDLANDPPPPPTRDARGDLVVDRAAFVDVLFRINEGQITTREAKVELAAKAYRYKR